MNIDEYDKYVLDWTNTIFSNFFWFFYVVIISSFMQSTLIFLSALASNETTLIGFIVFLFSVVQLVKWIGLPNLEYKPRSR